jgi:hypothetical protein
LFGVTLDAPGMSPTSRLAGAKAELTCKPSEIPTHSLAHNILRS